MNAMNTREARLEVPRADGALAIQRVGLPEAIGVLASQDARSADH